MTENLDNKEQIQQWYRDIGGRPGDLCLEEDPSFSGRRYWASVGRARVTIVLPTGAISEAHRREIKRELSVLKTDTDSSHGC